MLKSLALLSTYVCAISAAAHAPIREVVSQAAVSAGKTLPGFFKGYIYWAEPLQVFAPDGLAAYVERPAGRAQGFAADTDGRIAVAWSWKSGREGGIDFHDASGALARRIQTGRYSPTNLTFAEDHSLWTLGWQTDATSTTTMPDRNDYAIVRKFMPNGEQAGAYLPRSGFPKGLEPGDRRWQLSNSITVSHDRVGLWLNSGMSGVETEWVELDLDGKLTGRWRLDAFANDVRVAFTSDDHVFVYYRKGKPPEGRNPNLVILDRQTSTWRSVESPPKASLVSADGDALIFADDGDGPIHLRWYQHP